MIEGVIETISIRFDFFLNLTIEHLFISLTSIIIACIIGLLLGILISEHKGTSPVILGVVNFVYTIPAISLLGFLIPFSGIGNTTAVIALTIYALLPMVRNTHTGITNIPAETIEAARGMGSTNFQILTKVKIPLALPVILSGLRNMVVMTIALAGIASFIGAGGLGVAIYRGITTNNIEMVIAGSLLIAIMAFTMDFLVGQIEKIFDYKNKKKKKNIVIVAVAALLITMLAFSNMRANDYKVINVATKPMTEQYILGEMLKYAIEKESNIKVNLTQGVGGGTSNIQPGMEKGDFDLYPEYTGTGWEVVLKKEGTYHESDFHILEQAYKEQFNFTWLNKYGFNNTYGIAVTKEVADKYNIKTFSDLARHTSKLTFGAEYDFFEREDGYEALVNAYHYNFKRTVDLDIGLKYKAVAQNKVDVITIFTTDGQLESSNLVVLEDDKNLYPSYLCANVVRLETLDKYPELIPILEKFTNTISDSDMAQMNYLVEIEGREPKDVAIEYIENNKILK